MKKLALIVILISVIFLVGCIEGEEGPKETEGPSNVTPSNGGESPEDNGISPVPAGPCIELKEGKNEISENTVLCVKDYTKSYIVIIKDSIILDCNKSVLYSGGEKEPAIFSNKQGVTIKKCDIKNYKKGIVVSDTSKNTLKNKEFEQTYYGIILNKSTDNQVIGNMMDNNYRALYLLESSRNNIDDNAIHSGDSGIRVESGSNNNVFTFNRIRWNRKGGMNFISSSGNEMRNNYVSRNMGGLSFSESPNNKIKNNIVDMNNVEGISLFLSPNNIIENNHVCGNRGGDIKCVFYTTTDEKLESTGNSGLNNTADQVTCEGIEYSAC